MKKVLLLSILFLLSICLQGQVLTNVLTGTVGDYGLNEVSNVNVTLTLISPNPRTINNFQIRQDPSNTITGSDGTYYFTNIQWGKYLLSLSGRNGTEFLVYVGTNNQGIVPISSLITNQGNLPPNPSSNYYTITQISSLFEGIGGIFNGSPYYFYTNGNGFVAITNSVITNNNVATVPLASNLTVAGTVSVGSTNWIVTNTINDAENKNVTQALIEYDIQSNGLFSIDCNPIANLSGLIGGSISGNIPVAALTNVFNGTNSVNGGGIINVPGTVTNLAVTNLNGQQTGLAVSINGKTLALTLTNSTNYNLPTNAVTNVSIFNSTGTSGGIFASIASNILSITSTNLTNVLTNLVYTNLSSTNSGVLASILNGTLAITFTNNTNIVSIGVSNINGSVQGVGVTNIGGTNYVVSTNIPNPITNNNAAAVTLQSTITSQQQIVTNTTGYNVYFAGLFESGPNDDAILSWSYGGTEPAGASTQWQEHVTNNDWKVLQFQSNYWFDLSNNGVFSVDGVSIANSSGLIGAGSNYSAGTNVVFGVGNTVNVASNPVFGSVTASSFTGNGATLTNYPASAINNATGNPASLTNSANVFNGTFNGSIAGVTNAGQSVNPFLNIPYLQNPNSRNREMQLYAIPINATHLNAIGDSWMYGSLASSPSTLGFAALIAASNNLPLNNYGASGTCAADQWNGISNSIYHSPGSFALFNSGINDVIRDSPTAPVNLAGFTGVMLGYLTMLESGTNFIAGTNFAVLAGSWSNATTYFGANSSVPTFGLITTNAGALSNSVSGKTVIIEAMNFGGNTGTGGAFSVWIDGVNHGTNWLTNTFASINSLAWCPTAFYYPNLAEAVHSVVISNVGPAGTYVDIEYLTSPEISLPAAPLVEVFNIPPQTNYSTGPGGSALSVQLYNQQIQYVCDLMDYVGYPIAQIDTFDIVTEGRGTNFYNTNFYGDVVHLTNAGHAYLAAAACRQISRSPVNIKYNDVGMSIHTFGGNYLVFDESAATSSYPCVGILGTGGQLVFLVKPNGSGYAGWNGSTEPFWWTASGAVTALSLTASNYVGLPIGSSSQEGILQVDNITTVVTNGVISALPSGLPSGIPTLNGIGTNLSLAANGTASPALTLSGSGPAGSGLINVNPTGTSSIRNWIVVTNGTPVNIFKADDAGDLTIAGSLTASNLYGNNQSGQSVVVTSSGQLGVGTNGGASQTPWTSTINAGSYSLTNLTQTVYTTTNSGSTPEMVVSNASANAASTIQYNFPSGTNGSWAIQMNAGGSQQMLLQSFFNQWNFNQFAFIWSNGLVQSAYGFAGSSSWTNTVAATGWTNTNSFTVVIQGMEGTSVTWTNQTSHNKISLGTISVGESQLLKPTEGVFGTGMSGVIEQAP